MTEIPKPPQAETGDMVELVAVLRTDGSVERGWMKLGSRVEGGTSFTQVGKIDSEGRKLTEWIPTDRLNELQDQEFPSSLERGKAASLNPSMGAAAAWELDMMTIDSLKPGGRRYFPGDYATRMIGNELIIGESLDNGGQEYYILGNIGSDGARAEREVLKKDIDL